MTIIPAELLLNMPDPDPTYLEERAKEIRDRQTERKDEDVTDQPITAELHNWQRQFIGSKGDFVVWGNCYGDIRGRFRDGEWIRTSLIARIDGDVAVTLNSNYRLVGEEKADQE